MTKKKGLFGIFKSLSGHSEEEKKQREFAIEKAQEEQEDHHDHKGDDKHKGRRTEASEEMLLYAEEKLQLVLEKAGYTGEVSGKKSSHQISLEIKNSDDSGRIIGRDGSHINSLQTLVRAMLFQKFGEAPRVSIDNKNYQEKRISSLRSKALKSIDRLNENTKKVELEPMSANERREIHMLIKRRSDVTCYSNGEGKDRHIVIEKTGNDD